MKPADKVVENRASMYGRFEGAATGLNLEKFKNDYLYKQGDPEVNLQFERAFAPWWSATLRAAKGARLKRLKAGLTYASMYFLRFTWFAAFGSLKGLVPEYEVRDYKDGFRYIDFAFFTNAHRIAIEVDGRFSHRLNVTPAEYEDELMRQNHLVLDGWSVIRLAFQSIRDKPKQCQQVLQQMLGKWRTDDEGAKWPLAASNIMAYISRAPNPVSPTELSRALNLHRNTILRHLARLVESGQVVPAKTARKRNTHYRLPNANLKYMG
ncbi:winged helix-turn-helix domain-containing protein [Cohnella sp. GbtcB17]|uniref:winged helix-turn-helix domain-containing protein n=1 Tax=Cohnella sp. GbtcB17 TaxID=2824762 RepID=UPI001C2F6AC2|nr:winged helix-turn-helix domain-containing protein [Cohnella sp. GbtcB17]